MPICEIWIFSLLFYSTTYEIVPGKISFLEFYKDLLFLILCINSLEPNFQSHHQFNLISIILLPTQNLETRVLSQFSRVLFQSAAVLLQVPSKAAADVTFPNIVVSIRPNSIAAKKMSNSI